MLLEKKRKKQRPGKTKEMAANFNLWMCQKSSIHTSRRIQLSKREVEIRDTCPEEQRASLMISFARD